MPSRYRLVLPLIARGREVGVLALGSSRPPLRVDAAALAGDLADAAATLDNACCTPIQDADQRKNEFLAMLAHELRNPLAPISNAVQLLGWRRTVWKRRLGRDVIDRSRPDGAAGGRPARRGRITRGKIELKVETLDVATVVAAAIETCRPILEAHGHALTVSLPPGPLAFRGDFARSRKCSGTW